MKVRPSVKPICDQCKVIKRNGKVMVICSKNKKMAMLEQRNYFKLPLEFELIQPKGETKIFTLNEVYVPRSPEEKKMQRALLQYFRPEKRDLAEQALRKAGRADLIGFDEKCLIRPRNSGAVQRNYSNNKNGGKYARKQQQKSYKQGTKKKK